MSFCIPVVCITMLVYGVPIYFAFRHFGFTKVWAVLLWGSLPAIMCPVLLGLEGLLLSPFALVVGVASSLTFSYLMRSTNAALEECTPPLNK